VGSLLVEHLRKSMKYERGGGRVDLSVRGFLWREPFRPGFPWGDARAIHFGLC
jgi:hypothetical protein